MQIAPIATKAAMVHTHPYISESKNAQHLAKIARHVGSQITMKYAVEQEVTTHKLKMRTLTFCQSVVSKNH